MFVHAALPVTVPSIKRNTTPALTETREQAGSSHPAGLNVVSRVFWASGAGADWPEELEEL